MNLVRARRRYTPQARFATYLYRIAHNRLIDHYRRGATRPLFLDHDGDDDEDPINLAAADPRSEPEQLMLSRQQVERFAALLSALPPLQREAFVMHEEGGLSVEEIAQATEVNAETAKSRLRYAVAKLRRGLEEFR
jgi:RNA polymerase sigma-70 factor (ECF subfamily)